MCYLDEFCLSQMGQSRWWEQEIPMEGTIQKGELLTYNLTELIKPESYLVRLTPITRYGEGDSTERIITYSGRPSRFLSSNQEQVYKHCLSNLCGGIYTHSCLQHCCRSLRFTFMHSSGSRQCFRLGRGLKQTSFFQLFFSRFAA